VSSTFDPQDEGTAAEELRRSFATAWGEIGASWGVAPSTATVQGYLLVSDGPLSEPEVRRALGMSHRATSLALAQCEEWGLVERAELPRRSGQRGPAAAAWAVVDDNWEWFRRVAGARRERETAPALPVIERCATEARRAADGDTHTEMARLGNRLDALLEFVRRFEHGVETFVRGDARAIERLFGALDALDSAASDRLWGLLGELSTDELAGAMTTLSRLSPTAARRLVDLADQPVLKKLLGTR
jgi:DNA-binding transcriptional regulator GbsR (MarR family)